MLNLLLVYLVLSVSIFIVCGTLVPVFCFTVLYHLCLEPLGKKKRMGNIIAAHAFSELDRRRIGDYVFDTEHTQAVST